MGEGWGGGGGGVGRGVENKYGTSAAHEKRQIACLQ